MFKKMALKMMSKMKIKANSQVEFIEEENKEVITEILTSPILNITTVIDMTIILENVVTLQTKRWSKSIL